MKENNLLSTGPITGRSANQEASPQQLKPWMCSMIMKKSNGRSSSTETESCTYRNIIMVDMHLHLQKEHLLSAWKMLTFKHFKACKLNRTLWKQRLTGWKIISKALKVLFKQTKPPPFHSLELPSLVLLQAS